MENSGGKIKVRNKMNYLGVALDCKEELVKEKKAAGAAWGSRAQQLACIYQRHLELR
jgi:hypothetical protein